MYIYIYVTFVVQFWLKFFPMARMKSNLSDAELKDLVKVSMGSENPLQHVAFYRSATSDELCNRHQHLFVGVAKKIADLTRCTCSKHCTACTKMTAMRQEKSRESCQASFHQ